MFQLDLKRIETAIRSGRLDEAFDRLIQSPGRSHRDGQQLTDRLAAALSQRAGDHLAAGRLEDAESDTEKAIELAGRMPDLADLRDEVVKARELQSRRRHREQAVERSVKDRILSNQFTLAGKLLPAANEPDALAETLDHQRLVLDDAAQKMAQAVGREDYNEVIRIARSLQRQWLDHPVIRSHLGTAMRPLLARATADLASGRLDLVGSFLQVMSGISDGLPEFAELASTHERCLLAKRAFEQHRWEDMDRELGLLGQMHPELDWLCQTRQAVAETLRVQREIQSGPLGLLSKTPNQPAASPRAVGRKAFVGAAVPTGEPSLILQVDGVGGILLLTKQSLTIGSVSRSGAYDLPLRTDGPSDPIEIRRSGEDYFAQSESEFQVNDQPTRRRLLTSNETIQFGHRGRLKFRRPVPASGSAVLQLSGAALPRRDIRYVALMSDSLVLASSGGHFSIPHLDAPLILFRDQDGFAIKQTADPGQGNARLLQDQSLLVAGTRFSLRPFTLC
ncbi:MAG: hypothetical protein AAFU85_04800 [Planctomycetota bacterium]